MSARVARGVYGRLAVSGACARLGSLVRACAALAASVSLLAGCSIAASSPRADGGAYPPLEDAGGPDASVPATDAGPIGSELDDRTCGDFLDNDFDTVTDCDDEGCAISPICCVSSAGVPCCAPGAAVPLSFASCERGMPLAACMPAGTVPFGTPVTGDGSIVPNNALADSGALLPGRWDTTTTRLAARGVLSAGEPCDGCTEVVGFGVTAQDAVQLASAPLSTSVSVLLGRRDRVVRLIVADDLVDVVPLSSIVAGWGGTDDALLAIEIALAPDGTFDVSIGPDTEGASLRPLWQRVPYSPDTSAAIVVWGRSDNPGPGERRASLARVTVTPSQCDMPSALGRATVPVMPDDVDPWDAERVSSSSVVVWGDETRAEQRMVLAIDGAIWIAHGIDGGRFRVPGATSSLPNAVLAPPAGVSYDDPQLVRDEVERRFWLYLTRRSGGRSEIARARGGDDYAELFSEPEPVSIALPGVGSMQLDDPEVFTAEGARWMLLRTRTADGTQLRLLRESDGSSGADFASGGAPIATAPGRGESPTYAADAIVHAPRAALDAFDHDEVAAPTLARVRGVYRIYFAGRRGTRWSIGALASADLQNFQLVEHGAPLLRGDALGFDALSVSEPAAVALTTEPLVRVYYAGGDGARTRIGIAEQGVPYGGP